MKRRMARETAFQVLFQMDMNDIQPDEAVENVMGEPLKDAFLTNLINGVMKHQTEIDTKISEHLQNWSFDRLASVEKTSLRIAVYELMHHEDVPQGVVINEAIEVTNLFGDEKSGKFVNGVLSRIIKS
ncbi:NusB antitermination factor [Terribacillus aidingensis]|uniref:Transcription antitermination protein NusB n=1 Tax=Terribacillus aidingensis TaxID=586416 RepID=A0A285NP34_9BACI|nr:transcription antitermination factor NusB [Terribacillus aidingensis]SNZ10693.1 NusB antitermination factor [Terribacillus aidingensis]